MVPKLRLSQFGRVYLWGVISSGLLVIGHSLFELYHHPIGYEWFIIAGLTLISGSATVRLPSSYASISISETFVFTAVLLFGPAAGTLIVALDGLVISFWLAKRHREPHRALFNMSAPAISVWLSANLFFYVARVSPLVEQPVPINQILPALILFAVAYFGLNSWLITFIIALERGLHPTKIWAESFLWWSMNYFCGASVAILFVGVNRTIDLGYIGLILPLLLVMYATFKTSMGRVEDADKHVDQMNRLYLSTIETLAMAIDAKDQVTHGHIRRVQSYAMSLAKEVGVRDKQLLKAIEAAALLHDMGKIAVPEYILNKPGKLTETEFEKMKLHASVGADILSAIDFPYPVVPIVRHHHENWDGTGYPTGLRTTQIPIGARILAVVDCFDALTSDRPYRPRLSDDDALRILIERRATMYDPLVVDTFVRVHESIAPEAIASRPTPHVLNEIVSARKPSPPRGTTQALAEMASSADEMLSLYELARTLAGQVSLGDAGDVIAKHLRRLIPSSLCVFYVYDQRADELVAEHVVGDAAFVKGLRIPLGQRLSGWVAANRQTICNSDPALDFGHEARSNTAPLRSCLSTPLLSKDKLVGVLSLYSSESAAFNDDHRRIVEVISGQIGHTLELAIRFENAARRDEVTGLPYLEQLRQLGRSESDTGDANTTGYALLLIDIVDLKLINRTHGRAVGDEALRHVVFHARHGLRIADILFRHVSDDLVAFLNDTDHDTAGFVAARIRDRIALNPLRIRDGSTISVETTITCVSAPRDGDPIAALVTSPMTTLSTGS
jgi:diguanylate cyclase (GGDEF)-like protein/putative nucleotidyltransferase with HDIG domain